MILNTVKVNAKTKSRKDRSGLTPRRLVGIGRRNLGPKWSEFLGAEVSQNLAIDIEDGRAGLAGQFDHFAIGIVIGNDIDRFIIDAPVIEPADGFIAPAATGFY